LRLDLNRTQKKYGRELKGRELRCHRSPICGVT
jgi:hypothetical protein